MSFKSVAICAISTTVLSTSVLGGAAQAQAVKTPAPATHVVAPSATLPVGSVIKALKKTSSSWSSPAPVPARRSGHMAPMWTLQECVGTFGEVARVTDENKQNNVFYNALQQCDPPTDQQVTLELYQFTNTAEGLSEMVAKTYRGAVTYTLQPNATDACAGTGRTNYFMMAWGRVDGAWMYPTPAESKTFTIYCNVLP